MQRRYGDHRFKVKNERLKSVGILLVFLAFLIAPVSIFACPVCFPFPMVTIADRLIDAEHVILARENPEKPFSYLAMASLKGGSGVREIDLFINSSTRRTLNAKPGYAVILVRDDNAASWRSLGLADEDYQEVVKRILAVSREWTGKEGQQKRHRFFLSLFGHDNRVLHELAYLELGRAPYRMIRKMAPLISRDDLRPMLVRREYLEWRSLAILFLAQNPSDVERKTIDDSFRSCSEFSLTTNLAAWTTAYIELHGSRAIEEIENRYLTRSTRTADEIRQVIVAISVQGHSGDRDLRQRIIDGYQLALQTHPLSAASIANDLVAWKSDRLKNQLATIVKNRAGDFDVQKVDVIQQYLQQSAVPDELAGKQKE